MSLSLHDYILDHHEYDWSALLTHWAWLLPANLTPWILNQFGDLFAVLDDGTVHMLDIGCGTFTEVAESRDEFAAKLDVDDHAQQWLLISLVDHLVASGIALQNGQCYGFRQPPVLGGAYAPENTMVISIADYYGGYGSIHRQIANLPNGTEIRIRLADGDA